MITLLYFLNGVHNFGFLFLVGHIFPVYFSQAKTVGYDTLSLLESGNSYFRGTIQNNPYYNKQIWNIDMKIQRKFTLTLDIDVSGKDLSTNELNNKIVDALYEAMPSVLFDSEELDCQAFVNTCEYALVREQEDICGFCNQPGADKIPHPVLWPDENRAGTELVHAECEQQECSRASALCQGRAREEFLRNC